MTKVNRHRWSDPVRFEHKSERTCLNGCGVIKVSHHEGDAHWIDFWKAGADGVVDIIATDHTPPCEATK